MTTEQIPQDYVPPDAPLTIGGVLDDGFRLTRAVYRQVFVIALIGAFIANIPTLMITVDEADPLAMFNGVFFAVLLLSTLVSAFAFAWAIYFIHRAALQQPVSLGDAATLAMRRFPVMLVVFIAYFFIILLGYVALIVPGVILTLTLMFAAYLVITDNAGVGDSFKGSYNLVWGNWWRTAALFTVLFFVFIVIYAVVAIVTGVVIAFQGGESDLLLTVFEWVVAPLLQAAYMPVMYSCSLAILNDLKLRRQGDDLEARLAQVEAD